MSKIHKKNETLAVFVISFSTLVIKLLHTRTRTHILLPR